MTFTFWVLLGLASQSGTLEIPNLFYGKASCLPVPASKSLNENERLLILAPGAKPVEVLSGSVAKPTEGSKCWRTFRGDEPDKAASLPLPDGAGDAFFALKSPDTSMVISGPAARLSLEETSRWIGLVTPSLPAAWRVDTLANAYRYSGGSANSAVELYLGRATLSPPGSNPPIKSIEIRRFFIINGKVLGEEAFARASDKGEHVDMDPPSLTFENWSSTAERTVGFLSADKGASWTRLSIDIGFEGTRWIGTEMRTLLPVTYDHYFYTFH